MFGGLDLEFLPPRHPVLPQLVRRTGIAALVVVVALIAAAAGASQ